MKKNWKVFIGLILFVGLGVFGYFFLNRKAETQFEEVAVKRQDLELKITATGGVQPQNRLEIKPPVAGRIDRVLCREGDNIKKGAILAWMSSSERVTLIDVARSKGKQELKRWEDMYRPTPIVAPMSGILISRKVEPGQTLTAQDVALVMSNSLIVRADVDETDIAKIKVGESAVVTLDAYPKDEIKAKVDHIAFDAKTANNVTVYSVDLLPETTPDFMRSGMSANVNFLLDKKEGALVLRSDAIQANGHEGTVLVPPENKGDKPQVVRVSLGISDGRFTEITEGLNDSSIVLVPKLKLFKEGAQTGSNPFMPFGGKRFGPGGGSSRPPSGPR